MPILVMIIAGFTAAVVLALEAVSAAALQSYRISHALRQDAAETTIQHLLSDDILAWLDGGAASAGDALARRTRDARLVELGRWGANLALSNISRGNPSNPLFAKGVLLSARPGGNPVHPLESLSGVTATIAVSLEAEESYLGHVDLATNLVLRETPACDIAYISAGVFQPAADSTPLTIVGTALLPFGASDTGALGKMGADRLVASYLPSAQAGISPKRHVNPIYRASWGAPLASLTAAASLAGTPAPQGYFNNADRTIGIQATGVIGAPVAGVSYRRFPDGGPNRLVITLADLPPSIIRLYVNFEDRSAAINGIVVIGDPGMGPGVARLIGTNGSVWLWGDNNQPVAIGSGQGQWTLTDNTWTESSGAGLPDLNLAWAGHILSPVATTFTTPQPGPTARLNLNGSLTAGTCGGNLAALTITQQTASPLRHLVERVAYLYYFD